MSEQIKDGGPAGVLEVMERASKWMFCKRTGPDRDMGLWEARKAIAKLIEADREYDAASASLLIASASSHPDSDEFQRARSRVQRAELRRYAALASCEAQVMTTAESAVPRENLLWPAVDRMLVDAWLLGRDGDEMDMLKMRMRFRAIFAACEAKS